MAKQKTSIYREQLEDAYSRNFQEMLKNGWYLPTGKMCAISAIGEIIKQARSKSNDNIYLDGNRIVIREIHGLWDLGTNYSTAKVQAILRGLECNYHGMIHTCICFDLNSAVIDDLDGLVKELIA